MAQQQELVDRIVAHSASLEMLGDECGDIYRDGRPFVSIDQFLADDFYFGKIAKDLWPDNIEELLDIFDVGRNYAEIILTGATSIGKTFLCCIGMCYMIAKLGHYKDPHRWIGASPTSPIIFINMSINERKAREIIFTRVKNMVDSSPYFQQVLKRDRHLSETLVWRKENVFGDNYQAGPAIIFKPGTGDSLSALGDDIYGGAGDELNFFRIVESSRKAFGEAYDPAQRLYDVIGRRMRGRFSSGGVVLGKFWLLSSAQYPDDFIERRIDEARADGTLGTMVKLIRKSTWEARRGVVVMGKNVFSENTFRVEVGSRTSGSRLLDRYDSITGAITPLIADTEIRGKVIRPPVDLWGDFSRDVEGAVRDYGGEVTRAIKPFFPDSVMLFEAMRRGKEAGLMHPWSTETTTLADGSFILRDVLFEKKLGSDTVYQPKRHPTAARYFHIDLGVSGDPAALVVVHTSGWRGIFHSNTRIDKPIVEVDIALRMSPPTGGRLNFASLRGIVMMLREHGMWFAGGSFDQYQSEDSIQILNSSGIATKRIADDIAQYLVLKDELFEERLLMYEYEPLLDELLKLEDRSGRIDHPPGGHNDCAAALAHACFNLEMAELHGSPSQLDSRLPALPTDVSLPSVASGRKNLEEDMREFIGGSKIIRR